MTHSTYLSSSNLESRLKKTDIIIAPDGTIVYPQSLYLVSKLRGEDAVKDTGLIAKGLLAFTRYLDSTHYSQIDEGGNEIPPEYLTYKPYLSMKKKVRLGDLLSSYLRTAIILSELMAMKQVTLSMYSTSSKPKTIMKSF